MRFNRTHGPALQSHAHLLRAMHEADRTWTRYCINAPLRIMPTDGSARNMKDTGLHPYREAQWILASVEREAEALQPRMHDADQPPPERMEPSPHHAKPKNRRHRQKNDGIHPRNVRCSHDNVHRNYLDPDRIDISPWIRTCRMRHRERPWREPPQLQVFSMYAMSAWP